MRVPVILAALALSSLLQGQEARPINCRFLALGGNAGTTSVITMSGKDTEVICPLPANELSQAIVCTANSNTISFLSATNKKPLTTATIPAGTNAALLIFVHTPEREATSPGWRVLVIEDSPLNFPDGGAYVANIHGKDIRFVIGEHKGMLHAAGMHGYAKPEERDTFNMAPVVFEFRQDDKWQVANESALRFLPGMRYLIFAYTDSTSGRPRIDTYQDIAPAKAAP